MCMLHVACCMLHVRSPTDHYRGNDGEGAGLDHLPQGRGGDDGDAAGVVRLLLVILQQVMGRPGFIPEPDGTRRGSGAERRESRTHHDAGPLDELPPDLGDDLLGGPPHGGARPGAEDVYEHGAQEPADEHLGDGDVHLGIIHSGPGGVDHGKGGEGGGDASLGVPG